MLIGADMLAQGGQCLPRVIGIQHAVQTESYHDDGRQHVRYAQPAQSPDEPRVVRRHGIESATLIETQYSVFPLGVVFSDGLHSQAPRRDVFADAHGIWKMRGSLDSLLEHAHRYADARPPGPAPPDRYSVRRPAGVAPR